MRPVVPFAMRFVAAPVQLGEWTLPAGSVVAISVRLIHSRADLYEEPLAFRPERFEDAKVESYSWLPFGGGVRRCLGASFAMFEMQTVLARIVERCRLAPVDRRPERVRRRSVTLVPHRGARAVLRERHPSTTPQP